VNLFSTINTLALDSDYRWPQGDAEKMENSLKSSVKIVQSSGPFVEYIGDLILVPNG
jgi:hypothetical protein